MADRHNKLTRNILLTGVALTALVMAPAVMDMTIGGNNGFVSTAFADDNGDGGGKGKMGMGKPDVALLQAMACLTLNRSVHSLSNAWTSGPP